MNTSQTWTRSQCSWEVEVGHRSVYGHVKWFQTGASVLETRGFSRFNVGHVGSHVAAEPSNHLSSQAILVSSKLTNRRSSRRLSLCLACQKYRRLSLPL